MTITDTTSADSVQGNETDETVVIVADNADDSFDGDGGVDTVDASQLDTSGLPFDASTTIDLQQGFIETPLSGRDTLTNFENVVGSNIRDLITGTAGANVIQAGDAGGGRTIVANTPLDPSVTRVVESGDLIRAGAGADDIAAGGGDNVVVLAADETPEAQISAATSGDSTLDLSQAASAVVANLGNQGTSQNVLTGGALGNQTGETVSGFNGVAGTAFDDQLAAPRLILDGEGTDSVSLTGREGLLYLAPDGTSDDQLSGGGSSTLNFAFATSAVAVDLAAQGTTQQVVMGGGVGLQTGDTVSGFTRVEGSAFNDTLVGNDANNVFDPSAGNDTVGAGPGDDRFETGEGADAMTGGAGADVFAFTLSVEATAGVDTITDFDRTQNDRIELEPVTGSVTGPVSFASGVQLQDPTSVNETLFTDAAGGDVTNGVVVQDDGLAVTHVFADVNGTGGYEPGTDAAFALTGTIASTQIDAAAFGLEPANQPPAGNTPPATTDDTATTQAGQSVTIDVLANDSDPDGDSLVVSSVGTTPDGTTTIPEPGRVQFQPASGFTGAATFSYTASDQSGGQASGQVTVTVEPAAEARTFNFSFTTPSQGIVKQDSSGETFIHLGDTPTVIAETGDNTVYDLNGLNSTQPSTIESQNLISSLSSQDTLDIAYPDGAEPQALTSGPANALQNGPEQPFATNFVTPEGIPSAAGLILIENNGDSAWDYAVGLAAGAENLPSNLTADSFSASTTNSGGTAPSQSVSLLASGGSQAVVPETAGEPDQDELAAAAETPSALLGTSPDPVAEMIPSA